MPRQLPSLGEFVAETSKTPQQAKKVFDFGIVATFKITQRRYILCMRRRKINFIFTRKPIKGEKAYINRESTLFEQILISFREMGAPHGESGSIALNENRAGVGMNEIASRDQHRIKICKARPVNAGQPRAPLDSATGYGRARQCRCCAIRPRRTLASRHAAHNDRRALRAGRHG